MRAVSPSDVLGGRFSARRPRQRRPGGQPPARATEPGGRGCPQAHTPAGPARQQRRGRALKPASPRTRGPCRGVRTPDAPAILATVPCCRRRSGDRLCPAPRLWAKPKAPQSRPPSPAGCRSEAETGPAPRHSPGQSPKLRSPGLIPSAAAAKAEPSLAPHVGSVPSPPPQSRPPSPSCRIPGGDRPAPRPPGKAQTRPLRPFARRPKNPLPVTFRPQPRHRVPGHA